MKFIKLTGRDGKGVYANPETIDLIREGIADETIVGFSGDSANYIIVNETPDEILKLIKEAI